MWSPRAVWKEAKSPARTKFRPVVYVGKRAEPPLCWSAGSASRGRGEEGECASPETDSLKSAVEFMVLSSRAVISCPFSPTLQTP